MVIIALIIVIILYLYIGYRYFIHNRKMGDDVTGTIVALLWFVVAIMWCFGYYFEWQDERNIKKLLGK